MFTFFQGSSVENPYLTQTSSGWWTIWVCPVIGSFSSPQPKFNQCASRILMRFPSGSFAIGWYLARILIMVKWYEIQKDPYESFPLPLIFIRLRCKNKLLPGFFAVGHSKTLYNLYIHIDTIKRGCISGDLIPETQVDYYLINCLCTWIPRRTSSLWSQAASFRVPRTVSLYSPLRRLYTSPLVSTPLRFSFSSRSG